MAFGIGILTGTIIAVICIKMGFFETWGFTFNAVIAIYLGVFLGPQIIDFVPIATSLKYGSILTVAGAVLLIFLILHCICGVLITSQFTVAFPKIFDIIGAGLMGFIVGFIAWNFICLLIFLTPISQNAFLQKIGFDEQFQKANLSWVTLVCDPVNSVTSSQDGYTTTEAINALGEAIKDEIDDYMSETEPYKKDTEEPNKKT